MPTKESKAIIYFSCPCVPYAMSVRLSKVRGGTGIGTCKACGAKFKVTAKTTQHTPSKWKWRGGKFVSKKTGRPRWKEASEEDEP